jgi:uncharacterized damage-inducible protein DinB
MTDREQLVVEPLAAADPEIARRLWMLEDGRARTRECLQGIDPQALDWTPPGGGNSIGTLLYHLALIEADWLYVEVQQQEFPQQVVELLTVDARDEAGILSAVSGKNLAAHDVMLDTVRALLLDAYRAMTLDDFRRPRSLPQYDVTPEWVLHHLIQHEAEHRGQIGELRVQAERALRSTTDRRCGKTA